MLTSKLGIYFNKVKNKIILIQNRAECVHRQAGRQTDRQSVSNRPKYLPVLK